MQQEDKERLGVQNPLTLLLHNSTQYIRRSRQVMERAPAQETTTKALSLVHRATLNKAFGF